MRLAFDRWEIPFDLIHKDHVKPGNLRAKYDVIVMPHQGQGGKSIVYEQPKLSKPLPTGRATSSSRFGMYAETDDVRGGMGLEGAAEFQKFVDERRRADDAGRGELLPRRVRNREGRRRAERRSLASTRRGRTCKSEILIPNASDDVRLLPEDPAGPICGRSAAAGRSARRIRGSSPGRRRTGRKSIARFTGGDAGVLSGVMRGADQIRNRPMVVDAPSGKGHVMLFANNPIYRWQTFGEHAMVFNALLFWNDMDATATAKPAPTAGQQ